VGTRAPRVVILVENLPVPLDRRVWLEALALRDDDWQVVVIGPQGGHGMRRLRERIGDILVLRYPQREASGLAGYLVEYVPSMVFSLAWFIWARLSGPVDVVHGCNPPDLFWLFGRLGRLWGARYVFDLHDPNPELSLTKFGRRGLKGRALHRLTLALESASFRTADLVLTVNDTCKAIAIDRGGMPESNVIVLRNAPNTAEHRRLSVGIEPEGRGVGYVGVMGTHDGLDVLLDAWAIVKQEGDLDDARLDLVGDGPARDGLERQVADSGLASSVRFWGFLPPSEFVPILARTMVGVSPDLPNPFNDLSSMVKVIDYLAIGRGCVAFDLTETKRLGGEALMIARSNGPPGLASALIEVLRAPAEARRLGDLARGRIDGLALDWEPYRQALVKAYAPFKQRPSKSSG
jgi:glycosyltransferase involved in cell wall biosynthesis